MDLKRAAPTAEQAVAHVQRHGDVVDRDYLLRLPTNTRAGLATSALLGMPAAIHYEAYRDALAFTNPVEAALPYAVCLPVAIAGRYAYDHISRGRRVVKAEKMQLAIENELDEPVDLLRIGSRKNNELVLRWYGFDDARDDEEQGSFIERAHKVIDFAREHGIAKVAAKVDSRYLDGFSTVPGETFITDLKKTKYTTIRDADTAPEVVLESVGRFEELLERMEGQQSGSLVKELIVRLNDEEITRKYGQYERAAGNPELRTRLLGAIKRRIELDGSETQSIADKQPGGLVLLKRVDTMLGVASRGRALSFDLSRDQRTGDSEITVSGMSDLAAAVHAGTNEQLLARLRKGDYDGLSKTQLLSGLYLLLESYDTTESLSQGNGFDQADAARVAATTARMYSKQGNVAVERDRIVRRAVAAAAKKAGALVLGASLAYGALLAADKAWSDDFSKYNAYNRSHHLQSNIYPEPGSKKYQAYADDPQSGHSTPEELVWRIRDQIETKEDRFSASIAQTLVNRFHMDLLEKYTPSYVASALEHWQSAVRIDKVPVDEYVRDSSSSIGDVSTTANMPVYTITPLSGESTQGYWEDRIGDVVELNHKTPPFYGAGISLVDNYENSAKPVNLPYEQDAIEKTDPDFMVETEYIEAGTEGLTLKGSDPVKSALMPVKRGTTVVAARIADADNPDLSIKAPIYRTYSGMYYYSASQMDEKLEQEHFTHPVLQYWLKDSGSDILSTYTRGGSNEFLDIRNDLTLNLKRLNTQESRQTVAGSVRSALGLPKNASDLQVYDAIKYGKEYSYTPLARAGITRVEIPTDISAAHALAEVADVLARLDTMNCNVAAVTMMLGTMDQHSYVEVSGFNNGDGDAVLSEQEAHSWLLDSQTGKVVDATPTKLAPGEKPRTKLDEPQARQKQRHSDLERGAEVLMAAATMFIVWRRRKYLGHRLDLARSAVTLALPGMGDTIGDIERQLYADPARPAIPTPESRQNVQLHRSLSSIPGRKQVSRKGVSRTDTFRRIVLRMNHAAVKRSAVPVASNPKDD